MQIIIANVFGFMSSLILIYMGSIKEKNSVLKYQVVQVTFGTLCDLMLGAIPSVVTNILTIIRNILVTKNIFNKIIMVMLIILASILIISSNELGIIGYIPLINFIFYTIFINTDDNIIFKYIFIVSMITWLIYDLLIKAYSSSIFDLFTLLTAVITLLKMKKSKNNNYIF